MQYSWKPNSLMTSRINFFPVFCLVLITLFVDLGISRADDIKKLFILHSYEEGHVCGQPQHDGAVEALAKMGFTVGDNLLVETYFMDTKRTNNSKKLIQQQADIALEKITDFAPDVLITIDDNAFRTVALKLTNQPMAIVFSGMNAQPKAYNRVTRIIETWERPGHNITGVYEKLYFVEALRVHGKIFPDFSKTLVLVDTSPTGKAIKKQIELEILGEQLPCALEIKVVSSFEEYKRVVQTVSEDPQIGAIYPAALLLKDAEGNTYTAPDIFAWTIQNSQRPEIALNYSFTRMGLFGGAAVDFFAMGKQAGQMVGEIFKGKNAGALPIEKAKKFALAFNLNRANNLGIQLPPDILLAADEIVLPD